MRGHLLRPLPSYRRDNVTFLLAATLSRWWQGTTILENERVRLGFEGSCWWWWKTTATLETERTRSVSR
jgi:hypothetical protein